MYNKDKTEDSMAETTLKIEGMSCLHCVQRLKEALDAVDGVTESLVEVGTARVTFDKTKAKPEDLESAVAKAGYKVVA